MSDQDVQLVIRAANGLAARMEADLKEARAEIRRLTRERDEARREALEEAAALAVEEAKRWNDESAVMACEDIAAEIRSLSHTDGAPANPPKVRTP